MTDKPDIEVVGDKPDFENEAFTLTALGFVSHESAVNHLKEFYNKAHAAGVAQGRKDEREYIVWHFDDKARQFETLDMGRDAKAFSDTSKTVCNLPPQADQS